MARSGRNVLFGVVAPLGAPRTRSPPRRRPRRPRRRRPPESIAKAEQVLVESRKRFGGEKLAAVKTVVATGQTRRIRGNNLVPIDFEIPFELPDKYLRARTPPGSTRTGAATYRRRCRTWRAPT